MEIKLPNILLKPLAQPDGNYQRRINVPYFWKGGTSCNPQDWLLPANWYNHHVPGWFDKVVIPTNIDCDDCFPIIDKLVVDISQLIIEEGAKLVVSSNGKLTIDGLGKRKVGIYNHGVLNIMGELTICRTKSFSMRNKGHIRNSGSIAFDQPFEKVPGKWEGLGELLFLR